MRWLIKEYKHYTYIDEDVIHENILRDSFEVGIQNRSPQLNCVRRALEKPINQCAELSRRRATKFRLDVEVLLGDVVTSKVENAVGILPRDIDEMRPRIFHAFEKLRNNRM